VKRRTVVSAIALCCAVPRVLLAQHGSHDAGKSGAAGKHGAAGKKHGAAALNAAFAPDGSLWVVALNEQQQLFVQRSDDGGSGWSGPRVLDTGGDTIASEGESRPKLRFGPKGWAVIAYTRPLSKPYTGEIRMLRSEDAGASFSAPFTVHEDRQLITHRFESVAFDSTGALHSLWIDKRDLEAATRNGKTDYAGAALYRNVSLDGGRTFGPDIKVADHTCECCRIALAPAADGGLAAMWRHVFDGGIRDHAIVRIAPGGGNVSPIVRVSHDDWKIDACPHHGPGLAEAVDGGFHAVWFGIRGNEPAVRYARLDASGKPGRDVRVIPDTAAEHADVCSAGAKTVIAWRSFDGQRMRYVAWISRDGGKSFVQQQLGATDADADNPILVRRKDAIFALWRAGGDVNARIVA
jgi:hypothetical protein